MQPTSDEYLTERNVTCWILVRDNIDGSGVDQESLEYRILGDTVTDGWVSCGLSGSSLSQRFSITITFEDGLDNRIQFRGSDVAGNGPTSFAEYTILVDTAPPELVNVISRTEIIDGSYYEVFSAEIHDRTSGVDLQNISFRYQEKGTADAIDWIPIVPDISDGNVGISFSVPIMLGGLMTAELRAYDNAGNAFTDAWDNIEKRLPPIAVISSPLNGSVFKESDEIHLDSTGSYDPDSDKINFRWNVTKDSGNVDSLVGREHTINLESGTYRVELTVGDETNLLSSSSVVITVESEPRIHQTSENGIPWLLIIILILVVAIALALLVQRRISLE
jgi:hypothetical protein